MTLQRWSPILIISAYALLALLLFLPHGFNQGVTGDAWIYFLQTDEGNAFAAASATRLFLPMVWELAAALSPGAWVGFNVMLLLLLVARGWLMYALVRLLTGDQRLAFAVGAVALVIPVDTGVFYLGALAIHFTVFCFLLALRMLIAFWRTPRVSLVLLLWIALLFAVGTYELVYVFVAVAPLLLLVMQRSGRITRKIIGVTALWYLVPFAYGLWYLAIITTFPHAAAYQSGVMSGVDNSIGAISASLATIYARHLFTGWITPVGVIHLLDAIIGLAAGALVLLIGWGVLRASEPAMTNGSIRVLPRHLLLIGLMIIGLGVVIYLPTFMRDDPLRTAYYSSLGAALALVALCWWISLRVQRARVFFGLVALLVAVGSTQLSAQRRIYVEQSIEQQLALARLAQTIPHVESGTLITVIDDQASAQPLRTSIGSILSLDYMLPAAYADYTLHASLCWLEAGTITHCTFAADEFFAPSIRVGWNSARYDQLVVLLHDDRGFSIVTDLTPYMGSTPPTYDPLRLIDTDAPLPRRFGTLLRIH